MRLNYRKVLPKAVEAMAGLEGVVVESALEPELLELVKMRASQLNGCAYCLDMHSKDARARGEGEQRLHVLAAWREAPFYSVRERAALAWCEALTLLPQTGAPDDLYEQLRAQFDEDEIVALTLAIVAINGWNRFAVGFRSPVGSYVSPHAVAAQATEGGDNFVDAHAPHRSTRLGGTAPTAPPPPKRGVDTHADGALGFAAAAAHASRRRSAADAL